MPTQAAALARLSLAVHSHHGQHLGNRRQLPATPQAAAPNPREGAKHSAAPRDPRTNEADPTTKLRARQPRTNEPHSSLPRQAHPETEDHRLTTPLARGVWNSCFEVAFETLYTSFWQLTLRTQHEKVAFHAVVSTSTHTHCCSLSLSQRHTASVYVCYCCSPPSGA